MQVDNKTQGELVVSIIQEINPYMEVGESSRLLEDGFIDSMGLVILVSMLESSFGVIIPDDDVCAENFADVEQILFLLNLLKEGVSHIDSREAKEG